MARESKRKREERRFGRPERLADLIFSRPECGTFRPVIAAPAAFESFKRHRETALQFLSWAKVVQAQNVWDWFQATFRGEKFDIFKDIPVWKPPFRSLFVEFSDRGHHHGFLILDSDPDDAGESLLTIYNFMNIRGQKLIGPLIHTYADIGSEGQLLAAPTSYVIGGGSMSDEIEDMVFKCAESPLIVAALAVSFMNCKNVALRAHEPDRRLNRERHEAGRRPFVRYHTIDIEPMKTVLRTEGGIESNGLKKALHICRGHFADYSEDRPMFGRAGLHGRFWIPDHVRGSLDRGVVISDYNVNPPKSGGQP